MAPQLPACRMCRRNKKHFVCDFCQLMFSAKADITNHLQKVCSGWNTQLLRKKRKSKKKSSEKEFSCPKCMKSFNLESSLLNHRAVHNPEKPYKCGHCERRFKKKGTLEAHTRTHTGDKPYKCRFCAKLFRQKTSLNNHVLIHSGIKPHVCRFCFQRFTQVSNLTQHTQRYHKTEAVVNNAGNSQVEPKVKSIKLIFF